MADFNFYLNRQGSRGRQGEKGEQGFSPIITVSSDTLSEYILQIQTQDNVFLTTNLREHKEDLGGTYIRYNRETGVMYAGDADVGTESNAGLVRFATDTEFDNGDSSLAVTPAQVQAKLEEYDTSEEIENLLTNFVNLTGNQTISGDKTFSGNVYMTGLVNLPVDNSVITPPVDAPAGSTNVVNIDWVRRQSYSKDADVVHISGNETISGTKYFSGRIRTNYIQSYIDNITHDLIKVSPSTSTVSIGDTNYTPRTIIHGSTGITLDTPSIVQYTSGGTYKVLTERDIATASTNGIVKPDGTSVTIDADGTLHASGSSYSLPTASTTTLGGVKVDGNSIVIDNNGVISANVQSPTYTASNGIDISNDEISIDTSVVPTLSGNNTFSGTNYFSSSIIATNGITTGDSTTLSTTQTTQNAISSAVAVRYDDGYGYVNNNMYRPIIQYSHPLNDEQGLISIGTTSNITSDGNTYYAAGKLRLIAPEALTRYDGTNEYNIIDSNSIYNYVATSSSKGLVQPDNTTIDVDSNGILSVNQSGLTNLVDVDASNLTSLGKETITSFGMPDYENPTITSFVINTVYQAQSDSYLISSVFLEPSQPSGFGSTGHVILDISSDGTNWFHIDHYIPINNITTFEVFIPKGWYFKHWVYNNGNANCYQNNLVANVGLFPLKGAQ